MSISGAIPKNRNGARPKTNSRISLQPCNYSSLTKTNDNLNSLTNGCTPLNNSQHMKFDNESRLPISVSALEEVATLSDNESLLPMERRDILTSEGGVQLKRPALHSGWVENRMHINYTSPPSSEIGGDYVLGAMEAWIEQMEFYLEDLSWLLNLSHHRFWSQMVYNKSTSSCLESYLMGGPRWYDELPQDDSCLSVINKIHHLVFLIYLRMATFKESKGDFISPAVFGDIIYDNFLYDICKILDLCVIYGTTNKQLLEKIINNIFTYQPKYYTDLQQLIVELIDVMKNVELKLGDSEYFASDAASHDELGDIFHYLVDTFSSVYLFLKIFPKAAQTFHEKDFELRLSSFYEKVVPTMIENIYSLIISPGDKSLEKSLLKKVHLARLSMLTVFREILANVCGLYQDCGESRFTKDDSGKYVEKYIHIMTTSAEERTFITDYNLAFNIDDDISFFEKNDSADVTTLNFIREIVANASSELELSNAIENKDHDEVSNQLVKEECKTEDDTSGMNGYYKGEANALSDIELASLISNVQDLLPDLGMGFVKECLKYYNYSTEEVLNAVLEGTLPPSLATLDRKMELSRDVLPNVVTENNDSCASTQNSSKMADDDLSSVLTNRLNIYDDDEFDIWRKPSKAIKNKISKGKKKEETVIERDPTLDQRVKEIVKEYESNQGYSIYEDEEKYLPVTTLDYEDEYDDTYDGDVTGDVDNFGNDKKNFVVPTIRGRGALNTPGMNFLPESSEDEDQEEEGGVGQRKQEGKDYQREGYNTNYRRSNDMYNKSYTARSQGRPQAPGALVFTNRSKYGNRGNGSEASTERTAYEKDTRYRPNAMNNRETNRASFQAADGHETRQKMDSRDIQNNKQYEPTSSNGATSMTYRSNKNSGKSWRSGENEHSEENRRHGGKYKEDTNHGKAQDPKFRQKMIHKNEHRKNASFAKNRNNF